MTHKFTKNILIHDTLFLQPHLLDCSIDINTTERQQLSAVTEPKRWIFKVFLK